MEEDKRAEKIRILEQQIKPQLSITKRLLSIAAGLLLLLTVAFILRFSIIENKSQEWMVITTGEETYTATLMDNSKIALNKNSQLTYPDFFNNDKRLVKLVGEAFFEIELDAARPFIVETEQEKLSKS